MSASQQSREVAGDAKRGRAAEYVRMSTEHQRYSTENQADAIRKYADQRNLEIVKTYADEGKSGLKLDGRDALKSLIRDVEAGIANYETILVYDVSRWGRFQDADESAYYEYVCKRAGITVHYCAEQFENDGSPFSTMVKSFKRSMAGEYSRELSVKVFSGQCRLIELGYRQGGPPGYGLRRQLIDQSGATKGLLTRGEHKSIQTDRVVLVPGPAAEVDIVQWIFHEFVDAGHTERDIASILNERCILSDLGRQWTRGAVHQMLINEKYVGDNVWNRVSFKLKKKRVRNQADMLVRANGAFESIVDRGLFAAAQVIIARRSQKLTDEEMLEALKALFEQRGHLSGLIIDEVETIPSSAAYHHRFGSLLRAYQLVGYSPDRDYNYVEINRALRAMYPGVVASTIEGIESAGGHVVRDVATDLLTINGEFTASIVIVRCKQTPAGTPRWHVRFDSGLRPDITIAVRMDPTNQFAHDYYLLPRLDMSSQNIRLAEHNGVALDAYQFDTLDTLFELTARVELTEVA